MQQSPLPVEVCERILDAGYRPYRLRANGHYPGPGAYDTWRQTALVCSAWLPRSRRNLLHEVELRSAAHVDRLLRTLLRDDDSAFGFSPGRGSSGREHEYERVRGRRGSARLADIVVRVTVDTQDAYVPFTRMPLPRLLRNCTAYDLSRVDWGAHYPSRLVDAFLSSLWGQRILELQIALERGAFGAVLHLVWSLPVLRELTLYSESHQALSVPAGPREPDTAVCGSLRTLSIAYGCVTAAYPTHAFGRSIQELELSVNSCGVSASWTSSGGLPACGACRSHCYSTPTPATLSTRVSFARS
ncbi:hypothetical protein C8Q80DRAFT_606378 [Daedaleopsis nitida]|nr:hypothetical protein C8Q80DRAFT_606378 [Daedaleopsis nitida]